ncbi:MAG: hypothetical protein ACUVQQ_13005 [Thermogutta sp.]
MDDSQANLPLHEESPERILDALRSQRLRVSALLARRRERLSIAEREISGRLESLIRRIDASAAAFPGDGMAAGTAQENDGPRPRELELESLLRQKEKELADLRAERQAWAEESRRLRDAVEHRETAARAMAAELEAMRERSADLEGRLAGLQQRHQELAAAHAEASSQLAEQAAIRDQLEKLRQREQNLQTALLEREDAVVKLRGERDHLAQETRRAAEEAERARAESAAQRDAHEARNRECEELRSRLTSLQQRHQELAAQYQQTRTERDEAVAALAAAETRLEELRDQALSARGELETLRIEVQSLRQRESLWAKNEEEAGRLRADADALRQSLRTLEREKEELLRAEQSLRRELRQREEEVHALTDRQTELTEEYEADRRRWTSQWNERESQFAALLARCEELEAQQERSGTTEVAASADEELQRRYELAMQDLREWRLRCAELEKKLAEAETRQAQAAVAAATAPAGGILNWEIEKQRILAALEAEEDEGDEESRGRHLKIQEVVRKTEAALAEKDREIAELRGLLENQAANIGSMAVGAAALGQFLEQDEIIRQQREHLRQLEEEWKEKLRQAELEISRERAKIARERAALEERRRQLDELAGERDETKSGGETKGKSHRGRWLSRLGLASDEDAAGGK